jgi:hypothetical protein
MDGFSTIYIKVQLLVATAFIIFLYLFGIFQQNYIVVDGSCELSRISILFHQ